MGNALANTALQLAPQILPLIFGAVGKLVHRQEGKIVTTTTVSPDGGGHPAVPVLVSTTTPLDGPQKKAEALQEFEDLTLPILVPLVAMALGHSVDSAVVMPIVSRLIDDLVALNNALGIFPKKT